MVLGKICGTANVQLRLQACSVHHSFRGAFRALRAPVCTGTLRSRLSDRQARQCSGSLFTRNSAGCCSAQGFGSAGPSAEELAAAAPGGTEGSNPVVPAPPDLQGNRARTAYNSTSLAFLGDAVWELYMRRHCFFPPTRVTTYYENVIAKVRAEAQEVYYGVLVGGDFLTDQERDILRWGQNGKIKTPTRFQRSSVSGKVYVRATALECLIGWVYLEDPVRLHAIMCHLGLSADTR
mmetsp:Transcript_20166/g.60839  ORF Transcript_20166/g.60839 Transcript_20166/m.60839 type:complete len:236 (+) Transcript_20166:132-839(+)